MPHAGLMDESMLGPVAGPLQRARLHLRGGRRRLRQGKIPAGIATLYDAMSAALEWYVADPERRDRLKLNGQGAPGDRAVYRVLVRNGVLDGRFDFDAFDRLAELSLDQAMEDYEYRPVLAGVESVMEQLGVVPFDEAALPSEDPATY